MSIKCPKCKHPKSDVYDSRPKEDGIRRRRTCQKCEHRFSTQEKVFVSVKASTTIERAKPPSRPLKKRLTATPRKRKEPDFDSMTDEQLEDYIYSKDRPFEFIDDDDLL
jgi:transcriptional regulator NrdR family protein